MSRILVVDDEPAVLGTLQLSLEAHGFTVDTAVDGSHALMLAASNQPDLVLLDLGLPDMDGIDVLRRLRESSRVPVVILSVRDGEDQKIAALDAGADDYVTKPFAIGELLARIRAALRRLAVPVEQAVIATPHFRLDILDRRATVGGEEVRLTPIEWSIADFLVRTGGRLVTQRELLTAVWGPGEVVDTSHLRVHIGHLRRKLEPMPSRPRYFLTEPGLGYRFMSAEPTERW